MWKRERNINVVWFDEWHPKIESFKKLNLYYINIKLMCAMSKIWHEGAVQVV